MSKSWPECGLSFFFFLVSRLMLFFFFENRALIKMKLKLISTLLILTLLCGFAGFVWYYLLSKINGGDCFLYTHSFRSLLNLNFAMFTLSIFLFTINPQHCFYRWIFILALRTSWLLLNLDVNYSVSNSLFFSHLFW